VPMPNSCAQAPDSRSAAPPVGHVSEPIVLIDGDLEQFAHLWAAAGTPNAVFKLTLADLLRLTRGLIADLAERR